MRRNVIVKSWALSSGLHQQIIFNWSKKRKENILRDSIFPELDGCAKIRKEKRNFIIKIATKETSWRGLIKF